jgi:deoxyadenosine/deoxycytidine kinase
MPVYTIDGNIGCGKSTLLEYLHAHYIIPIDLEPVKKWQPFLEDMYYKSKGAYSFQVRVWLDRCWIQPKPDISLVMERSPYFQKNVFIPINKESCLLSDSEYEILNEMYDKSAQMWSPSGYIYLRSNPTRCVERIQIRNRPSEEAISVSYIQKLHDLHESSYFWAASNGIPIICIDVEYKTIPEIAKEVINAFKMMGMHIGHHTALSNSHRLMNSENSVRASFTPTKTIAEILIENSQAAKNRKMQKQHYNRKYNSFDQQHVSFINKTIQNKSGYSAENVPRILRRPHGTTTFNTIGTTFYEY